MNKLLEMKILILISCSFISLHKQRTLNTYFSSVYDKISLCHVFCHNNESVLNEVINKGGL